MPERDLDLLERRTAEVGELGEGAPEIMRRYLAEPGLTGVGDDRLEDPLGRKRARPDPSGLGHTPQHGPGGDLGGRGPAVEGVLGPRWHRDGADAAVLTDEIDDRPAALALRDVGELQPGELPSPQPAPHQQPQQHPISQPFCRFRIRLEGRSRLCHARQQPIRDPEDRPRARAEATEGSAQNRANLYAKPFASHETVWPLPGDTDPPGEPSQAGTGS